VCEIIVAQIRHVAKSRQLRRTLRTAPKPPTDPLAALRREVDIMRALQHPNLVRLFEVIDDRVSDKVLMVVEYCEGGALVRPGQLTPERRMPEPIAQFYFRQMAAGLAYLHGNNVVHGDMKPENVLLAGDATVKIADFGQSQFLNDGGHTTFKQTLGTPAYLAPEVCAGREYRGQPADVWALGISLYYLIFGELPFGVPDHGGVLDLYDAIASGPVTYPSGVTVSFQLQHLFGHLLCYNPDARISAHQVQFGDKYAECSDALDVLRRVHGFP
jgi:calcium/calmodulin-dependent protein kinase kinase 2